MGSEGLNNSRSDFMWILWLRFFPATCHGCITKMITFQFVIGRLDSVCSATSDDARDSPPVLSRPFVSSPGAFHPNRYFSTASFTLNLTPSSFQLTSATSQPDRKWLGTFSGHLSFCYLFTLFPLLSNHSPLPYFTLF